MLHNRSAWLALIWLTAMACAGQAETIAYDIDTSKSVFAIVIHKAGIASALAHNHFIYPGKYELTVTSEGNEASTADFDLTFEAKDLVVDDPSAQEQWFPLIEKLGILKKPFSAMSNEDRQKVRETMLSEVQLDAAHYPKLSAELTSLRKNPATEVPGFDYTAMVALTVRGTTVESPYAARVEQDEGRLSITAFGTYRFTQFGIDPFSALLGAIQNEDEFQILAHFEAKPSKAKEIP